MAFSKLKVDRDSGVSLAEQIYAHYSGLIREGGIAYGTKLPSIRDLAENLALNKIAVVGAYERLVAEALIHARPGSGYFVVWHAKTETTKIEQVEKVEKVAENSYLSSHIITAVAAERSLASLSPSELGDEGRLVGAVSTIHLGAGYAPFDHLPIEDLRSMAKVALQDDKGAHLGYEHMSGIPEFRRRLVDELHSRGILVENSEQILVTTSIVSTINLVLETLIREGQFVAVEVPFYGMLFPLLKEKGIKIIEVDRNPEQLVLSSEKMDELRKAKPKLIILTPNFHNPTGGVLSPHSRYEILRLADEIDSYILELDIYYGLGFGELIPPSLAALDGLKRVIYVSSFTRSIAAGIRVGFIGASKSVAKQIFYKKVLFDVTCSNNDQALVSAFMARGLWRKHLHKLRDTLRSRRDTLIAMLKKLAPLGSVWTIPEGGNFLWFEFPPGPDISEIQQISAEKGIEIAPGSVFYSDIRSSRHMRLSYGMLDPVRTYHGLETVFAIWRAACQRKAFSKTVNR